MKPKEDLPEGEKLAVTQFSLHAVTMILRLRTRDAVLANLEYRQSKKRLITAVGQEKADEVEASLFEEEGSLLSLPPGPPDINE